MIKGDIFYFGSIERRPLGSVVGIKVWTALLAPINAYTSTLYRKDYTGASAEHPAVIPLAKPPLAEKSISDGCNRSADCFRA